MYFKHESKIKVNSRHVQTIRVRLNEETDLPEIVFEMVMGTDEVVWTFKSIKERDRVFEEIDKDEYQLFVQDLMKDLKPLISQFMKRAKEELDREPPFWDPTAPENKADVFQMIWEVVRIDNKSGETTILRENAEFLPGSNQSIPIALNTYAFQQEVIKGYNRTLTVPKPKYEYVVQKSPFH